MKRRSEDVKSTGVTFEDHEAYTTAPVRPILRELRSRVLGLDARLSKGEQCTAGHRIAYKIPGSKIFLEIKVHRGSLGLHLADGGQSDPSGITSRRFRIGDPLQFRGLGYPSDRRP
jgi:hypothetical protein